MSASLHGVRLLALAVGLSTAAAASAAQPTWEGSVGAGAIYAPDYLGSDDYEWNAWPSLDATYGDTFFVSVTDGIGWNLVREGKWRVAPFIGYTFGRDDTGDIRALDQVDGGATAGLRASYLDDTWRYSAAAETPFTGDIDGYRVKFAATHVARLGERAAFTVGPRFSYTSAAWTEDLFGVSTGESARSGIRAYDPNDGYFTLGADATLSYYLTRQWSITGLVGVARLTGDAEDSPIVDDLGDATQWRAGAFINYHF
ncbi:MipA/OmpV family protein [Salinicola sp. JS01]|uniref:MipA/OmpV family protein n=1 Tax=Salinicola sp. JS01 TaxID=3050071 RepID=UPI00255BA391|nr:MipA/OmpV family protein [Salinicola sp. JS01]WIX33345.1 MipA/OmpV family protein [Salinicola sp. JS01]